MAAKEIQPPQTLKVLCFGASLTAGYSHHGIQFHPYAERLKLALQGALPSTSIEIVVDGLSGAQVRRQYIDRLSRACQEVKGEPYNWIIIQGGTNDLAWGGEAEAIFEALQNVWNIALETGANVLALNVPESAARSDVLRKKRNELNDLIAEHEADRLYHMDLCKAIPYFAMEEKKRHIIWDHDGLHLTAEGYDMMGDAIGARMVELLPTL